MRCFIFMQYAVPCVHMIIDKYIATNGQTNMEHVTLRTLVCAICAASLSIRLTHNNCMPALAYYFVFLYKLLLVLRTSYRHRRGKVVLTASGVMRGTKPVLLKTIVDDAVKLAVKQSQPVTSVLCLEVPAALRASATPWDASRDVWWGDVIPMQVSFTSAVLHRRQGLLDALQCTRASRSGLQEICM